MFKCNVCKEKDLRLLDKDKEIERLLTQISHLNSLIFPSHSPTTQEESIEFNRILDGSDVIDVDPKDIQ